jgi:hypothetical protein
VFDWTAGSSTIDHANQDDLCDRNDGMIDIDSTAGARSRRSARRVGTRRHIGRHDSFNRVTGVAGGVESSLGANRAG